jgi:ZIP family zinc transporter
LVDAFLLGAAAQSSLLLSGLAVYLVKVPKAVIGALAGFGAGALISAIAFDLIPQGEGLSEDWELALWLLIGGAVFIVSDAIVESRFGEGGGSSAMGIVVGAVVDGVPESLIFGIQVASGQSLSTSFLVAVFVSNVPQALAPSADLATSGWRAGRMALMWGTVVLACGVASGLGFTATDLWGLDGDRAAAFAAGGLLAMLTDSLMPFALERGGTWAGIWTVVGFGASLANAS